MSTHSIGHGLTGMNDRVSALNGTLRIDSPATCGTILTMSFPLNPTRTGPRQNARAGAVGDLGSTHVADSQATAQVAT